MRIEIRALLLVLGLLALVACGGNADSGGGAEQSGASTWPEADWNPASAAVDVRLSLPCGGSIALRRVVTPTNSNWLSDMELQLGDASSALPYADFVRGEPLAGTLTDAKDASAASRRYYLIGVYEVTQRQYAAVTQPADCAAVAQIPALAPLENVTWFDAVEFTRRLTEWLAANHPQELQSLGPGMGAFVKLPTEAEWEFAARGGFPPESELARKQGMFPIEGDVKEYVWFLDGDSCAGRAHSIGRLKPNPLGLYDIVGNVQEIVFEPFRLNAHGRLHGQSGGFVARGGSCSTPRGQLSTALRVEVPYFERDSSKARAPVFTGFRVAVGAAVLEESRVKQFEEGFAALGRTSDQKPSDERLRRLVDTIPDERTQQELDGIAADFSSEMARRNRISERSVRSMLTSGALLIRLYRLDSLQMRQLSSAMSDIRDDTVVAQMRSGVRALEERVAVTRGIYGSLLVQAAQDFAAEEIVGQVPVAKESLKASPRAQEYLDLFVSQVRAYQQNPGTPFDSFFEAMLRTAD